MCSSKIYDKRNDFDFDIVNFPFLDDDVPRRDSYGVYITILTDKRNPTLTLGGKVSKTSAQWKFGLYHI